MHMANGKHFGVLGDIFDILYALLEQEQEQYKEKEKEKKEEKDKEKENIWTKISPFQTSCAT